MEEDRMEHWREEESGKRRSKESTVSQSKGSEWMQQKEQKQGRLGSTRPDERASQFKGSEWMQQEEQKEQKQGRLDSTRTRREGPGEVSWTRAGDGDGDGGGRWRAQVVVREGTVMVAAQDRLEARLGADRFLYWTMVRLYSGVVL
ncbi:hypothetical protein DM02DRAFT_661079 [Periconia macrospinosa]|uniref:Uncharacterized protein n=1 Tax=Periconia macrospinosa TaxID=97972 RepID=A0A2V1D8J4_9PLEO|nr:hypothetical protein DM02DRAFT_661079 [Periconia macrospinosa]